MISHYKNVFRGVYLLRIMPVLISIAFITSCSKDNEEKPFVPVKAHVTYNIEYAANADTSGQVQHLLLDIYSPMKDAVNQKSPLVILIHPGSYLLFSKDGLSEQATSLSDSGFIAVSIDYRLGWRQNGGCEGTENTLADAQYRGVQDATAAISFLLEHAQQYDIDTNWIFIGGLSAGGAMALNSSFCTDNALKQKYPEIYDRLGGLNDYWKGQTPNSHIKGIFNICGAVCDSNFITTQNTIPTICFHGTADELVPFDRGYFLGCNQVPAFGSLCIYRRLISQNGICVLYEKEGGLHLPWEFSSGVSSPIIADFFHAVMKGTAQSAVHIQ